MFTTRELIYSQPQHRQSLPLPQNRHKTVSNHIFRAMRRTILCDITENRLVRICTSHNNDFPQQVTPLTGSFIALLIQ